ncbi:MAG: DUF5719 family protein [Acidimicrobiia bacterium]|nr:DUF5719 family protein [Acidimicrobiia bacterium]
MKRIALTVLMVVGGTFVALFPVPDRSLPPVTTQAPDVIGSDTARTVAYCPWARSDAILDSTFSMAVLGGADVEIMVPRAGQVAGSVRRAVPDVGSVVMSSVVPFGSEGGVVEFTAGPASALSLGAGPGILASADCRTSLSKVWLLAGGSTLPGELLELRLFNPFPQDAKVTIRVTSENGAEPESTLETVSVPARSTRTFDLARPFPQRGVLALSITDPDGFVIPALNQALDNGDVALWTAGPPADQWFFPYAGSGSTGPGSLVLVNDGVEPTSFLVTGYTAAGTVPDVTDGILQPRSVVVVPLADLGITDGFEVAADAPIGAFLIGRSDTARAGTRGVPTVATRWLVPGVGSVGLANLAIMNPGTESVTATVAYGERQEKVAVPAGTSVAFVVPAASSGAGGFVSATGPVVVGWTVDDGVAVAFSMATPIADE